jgi:hypothetical protein
MSFILWIVINGLIGYAIGKRKDGVAGAMIISILLGPIGWLIAALWPGDTRVCPFCAELARREAKVCKHCGRELTPLSNTPVIAAGRLAISLTLLIGVIWLVGWLALTFTRPARALREAEDRVAAAEAAASQRAISTSPALRSSPAITPEPAVIHYAVATATPPPLPALLTLTQTVSIPVKYGEIGLQAGTKLELIGVRADKAHVQYHGAEYWIPLAWTDRPDIALGPKD